MKFKLFIILLAYEQKCILSIANGMKEYKWVLCVEQLVLDTLFNGYITVQKSNELLNMIRK